MKKTLRHLKEKPIFLLGAAFGLLSIYFLTSLFIKTAIFSDSSFGFLAWKSWNEYGVFNNIIFPDPENLKINTGYFLTTWTPGQYIIPGVIGKIVSDLGLGIIITVAAFSAIGLYGFYSLFLEFNFSKCISSLTCLFIVGSRFFSLPFNTYNGGEVLLFGIAPWAALALYKTRYNMPKFLLAILLSLFACTFAKLTGLIYICSIIGGILLLNLIQSGAKKTAHQAFFTFSILALFAVIFYFFWIKLGWTAATGDVPLRPSAFFTHALPMAASVVFSAFSVGELLSRLFLFPTAPILSSIYLAYIPLIPLAAWLVWRMIRTLAHGQRAYLVVSITSAALYWLVLCLLYIKGSPIDVDDRHVRMVSLLLAPGILVSIISLRSILGRVLLLGLLSMFIAYGLASALVRFKNNLNYPVGSAGFRQNIIDGAALQQLHATVDSSDDPANLVLYVPSPDIALDFPGIRSIATHADFESPELLAQRVYKGRPKALVVAVQEQLVQNGKADIILKSFIDIGPGEWASRRAGSFRIFEFHDSEIPQEKPRS